MDKQQKELARIEALIGDAYLDLIITDVRKISRADALEIARAYGNDWQRHEAFQQKDDKGRVTSYKGVQNAGSIDLIEIFYTDADYNNSGSVMVGNSYNRELSAYYDFNVRDGISIFYHKKKPYFVYNHATNHITSCFDANNIVLHPNTGLTVKNRAKGITALSVGAIDHLRKRGHAFDAGETPRAKTNQVRYMVKPSNYLRYVHWALALVTVGVSGVVAIRFIGSPSTPQAIPVPTIPTVQSLPANKSNSASSFNQPMTSLDLRRKYSIGGTHDKADVVVIKGENPNGRSPIAICDVSPNEYQTFLQTLDWSRRNWPGRTLTFYASPCPYAAGRRETMVRCMTLSDTPHTRETIKSMFKNGMRKEMNRIDYEVTHAPKIRN